MVATWKDKNKSANITGEICLRNPFEVSIVPSEKMGEMGGEEGLGGGWYGPQTILLGSKLEPILTQNARILIPNPPQLNLTNLTFTPAAAGELLHLSNHRGPSRNSS